jgi:hypothetical protein
MIRIHFYISIDTLWRAERGTLGRSERLSGDCLPKTQLPANS